MTTKLNTQIAETPLMFGESSLVNIKLAAERNPEIVFSCIAHRIDINLLLRAYKEIKKGKSSGVDKVTAKDYEKELHDNLFNLHSRLLSNKYKAYPVNRIWIEKEGNKQRPIGILCLEDKIVQKAVAIIMTMIFEVNFHDFSYGFRSGFNQHMAIKEIREQCISKNIKWIVSADITGLFDNIEHDFLMRIIKKRINDGGILRLIGKWLKSGVMENGDLSYPDKGTPQGGVISPILSNIFLHYVLDDWLVQTVGAYMKGKCFVVRFADDFILGFEAKEDALNVMKVLPKRFNKYGLELHPDKTKMIPFGKPNRTHDGKGLETFDFLGFTFYWAKSLKGYWIIKKKTIGKRLRRSKTRIWEWCRENRHNPLKEQYEKIYVKLTGHYQYYGVRSNYEALNSIYQHVYKSWRYWLNRRGSKRKVLYSFLTETFKLPKPRIVHNI